MKKYYLMAVEWIGKDGRRVAGLFVTVSFVAGLITGLIL